MVDKVSLGLSRRHSVYQESPEQSRSRPQVLILCGLLISGCAAQEELSVYETVRFKQSIETAEIDRNLAVEELDRLRQANAQLELVIEGLTASVQGAQLELSRCESGVRAAGVRVEPTAVVPSLP